MVKKSLIDQDNEYYREFTSGLDCDFYVYKGKTKEERHQELLQDRDKNIGASEVGKIMNLSDYGCATLVYRQKKGLIPPQEESWPMLRGQALEPVVLSVLRKKHPHLTILDGNKILCISKEYSFLRCNVDAMIIHPNGNKEGLEIKNISPYNKDKWDGGTVPDDYYAQCQFSMMITGLNLWRLAVSFDCEPLEYYVERDDDFIKDILSACLEFNQALIENIEPPLDKDYYDEDTFQALYPEGKKQKDCVIATTEIGQVLLELADINKQQKELEARAKYLKPLAEFYLGDRDATLLYETDLEVDGEMKPVKVTARTQTSNPKPKFSVEEFKAKHPKMYGEIEADCMVSGKPSRSFGWVTVK